LEVDYSTANLVKIIAVRSTTYDTCSWVPEYKYSRLWICSVKNKMPSYRRETALQGAL